MGDKSKKGQRFLVVLTVVSLLVIISVLLVGMVQGNGLKARVAVARKVGFPMTGKDIVPSTSFQPHENAAPVYERAISTLRTTVFTDKAAGERAVYELFRRELTAKEHADLSIYLTEASPAVAEFKSASAMPYCYFAKDWDKGAGVMFPEYSRAKDFVRALTASAWLKAQGGKLDEAEDDLHCAMRAAVHFRDQPTLIAILVSIALEGKVSSALQHLLSEDENALAMIEKVASQMPEQWDLTPALRTEAFFMFWLTRDGLDLRREVGLQPSDGFEPAVDLLQKSAFVRRSVRISVLDAYTHLLRSYKLTGDERVVLEDFDKLITSISTAKTPTGIVFSAFGAHFRGLAEALDRARSRKANLLAAVRILEHRGKKGAWPATLSEAGAEFKDPYDSKPLRYRVDGAGFRVWSVGEDGHDNGGLSQQEAKGGPFDEVLVYPRLP